MTQSRAPVAPATSECFGDATAPGNQQAAVLAQSLVDLCLAERVERALHATGFAPLRAVEVSVTGEFVILRGRVPSYYMKQLAQAVAMEVEGIRELRNDVQVALPCASVV
jgi:osmotically-inducible protein OsmY